MDSGLFLVSKKRIFFWIISPILFIAILFFSFFTYFKSVGTSLEEKRSLYEYMPIISQKIAMAETILSRYETGSSEIDVKEDLNTQLAQMAELNNFIINSLKVERENGKVSGSGGGISIFKVALKGEGSLSAIIGFFNETSLFDRLFAVENVDIRVVDLKAADSHSADFLFSYYALR